MKVNGIETDDLVVLLSDAGELESEDGDLIAHLVHLCRISAVTISHLAIDKAKTIEECALVAS